MSDAQQMATEKSQHESLTTVYSKEYVGVPFRILGDTWERFKSDFDFKDEDVFGMRPDPAFPVTARINVDGTKEVSNFAVYDKDSSTYVEAEYHDYETFEITRADGTVFRGRLVDHELKPWDSGNFQLLTAEGWQTVDYNSLTATPEDKKRIKHEARLKVIHMLPASFLEPQDVKKKTVKRAKLELTKTAFEALRQRTNTLRKAKADPMSFVYAFRYMEADKQYIIHEDDYRDMTDEERAAADTEDATAATSSLDALTPPGGKREGGDPSWMDNADEKIAEIPF